MHEDDDFIETHEPVLVKVGNRLPLPKIYFEGREGLSSKMAVLIGCHQCPINQVVLVRNAVVVRITTVEEFSSSLEYDDNELLFDGIIINPFHVNDEELAKEQAALRAAMN